MGEPAIETAGNSRKSWIGLLAKAELDELENAWARIDPQPGVTLLRGPETGLVMARGRIGGGGAPFNLGEVTVSRASVRLSCGSVGHGQTLGTIKRKAELAAIFDALAQTPEFAETVEREVLAPVARRIDAQDAATRQQVAATRVDFFTMVRGED